MPSLLDIGRGTDVYRFELLTAHLWELHRRSRTNPVSHHHDVYHVVLYVGGRGSFSMQGERHSACPARLVLVSPGDPHSFASSTGWIVYHEITFSLRSEPGALREPFVDLLARYTARNGGRSSIRDLDEAAYGLIKVRMESIVGRLLDAPVRWYEAYQLLIDLFGLLVTTEADTATRQQAGLDQRIQSYILANYADPGFSLKTMASDLHVSPEHLCREFRKHSGIPPLAYRNHLRSQAARNLLRNTDLPCKAIADKLGYSDHYSFSKAYYRMTGKRPSHERKRGVDHDK